ncbi:hypothetical protein DPMN_097843 [Dreissena polymorpha]|uniref:Uncharacterized protein n=1 Tax=Dreissena polymorpha TaxID=45954 RepID=A0A9D4LB79_DREPO|nr:hypothetical protein DPMN_097843 [Dreissena polymorpha]
MYRLAASVEYQRAFSAYLGPQHQDVIVQACSDKIERMSRYAPRGLVVNRLALEPLYTQNKNQRNFQRYDAYLHDLHTNNSII